MFKKRLITISALPFVSALLLGSSLIISNKPEKVSATNETHEHDDWTGVTELPTETGNYNIYLTDNVELSETWTVPEGTTNLCLNGYVINANGGNFTAITIPTGATLNLYDCGNTSHNGYVDSTGLWHLGEGSGTAKTITGGIITGGNATTNGGGVNVSGTFNMYGGNIAGNTAENGGGVSNSKSFTMAGGNIVGNKAKTNGGGVYASSVIFVNILTGGTISDNTAQNGGGVYYQVEQCFAPGTLITMADGTRQAIETLNIGDSVRVFDHEKGEISSSKIFDVWTYPEKHSGVVKLYFSNDIDVTVVYGHSFFEHEQNKYVAVTRDNVSAFVGHEFYNVDNKRWETLEGYEFIDGEVDTYVITTEYQLNCVANGMLSNEDGFYSLLTNIFDYGDNLKIDQVKKEQDIANFGLYGYENIKHMSKHVYDILNFQYLKVAFGRGLITENEFNYLEEYYAEVDPELYCNGKEETPVSKSGLLKSPFKAPLLTSSVPTPTSGFYVGGSIKILGNNGGNLYLSGGKTITLGTGTVGDGNGVVVPTEDMNIGITLPDGTGQFTTNGTANYSSNFFSDSENYKVFFNSGTEEIGDEYLELKEKTIADILPAHFPTSTDGIPENAWINENGVTMFVASQKLVFNGSSLHAGTSLLDLSIELSASDGNYTCPGAQKNGTVTFKMSNGKLVSVVMAGYKYKDALTGLNGEYTGTIVHNIFREYKKVEPTCTVAGHKAYYECDCGAFFSNSTLTQEIIDLEAWLAEGGEGYISASHDYQFVEFVWEGYTAKAKYVCSNDPTHIELHDATITSAVTTEPTCTTGGVRTYTATYDGHTDTKTEVIDAINHNFAFSEFVWDEFTAKAKYVCSNDSSHVEYHDATITSEVTTQPTCTTDGVRTYTATYDGHTDTKTEVIDATNHNFAFSEFVWSGFTAKAKYVCSNDSSHIELHDATITSAVTTEPTCTTDGVRTYTATYDGHTDTKTEVIDATGHTYGKPTSSWNGNQVTLTVKCSCNDEQHQTFTGTYTKVSDAICTAKETGKYVVTITEGIFAGTYESSVFETGNPLGHTYGSVSATWDGDQATLTTSCSCGDVQTQIFTGTYTKVSNATCTAKETGKYVVTIAEGIFAGTYESNVFETGNPSGHETTKVNGQSATSSEDGYKDAYYCNDCGLYFENADGTGLIGDSTAYEVWKLNEGFLPRLLSTGAIAGIVIGSVFGLLIIAFAVLYILWKRKNLNVPILSKVLTPAFRFINELFFKTKLNDVEAKEAENKSLKE